MQNSSFAYVQLDLRHRWPRTMHEQTFSRLVTILSSPFAVCLWHQTSFERSTRNRAGIWPAWMWPAEVWTAGIWTAGGSGWRGAWTDCRDSGGGVWTGGSGGDGVGGGIGGGGIGGVGDVADAMLIMTCVCVLYQSWLWACLYPLVDMNKIISQVIKEKWEALVVFERN